MGTNEVLLLVLGSRRQCWSSNGPTKHDTNRLVECLNLLKWSSSEFGKTLQASIALNTHIYIYIERGVAYVLCCWGAAQLLRSSRHNIQLLLHRQQSCTWATAAIAEIQLLVDVTRTTYYVRKGQEKDEPSMQSKSTRVQFMGSVCRRPGLDCGLGACVEKWLGISAPHGPLSGCVVQETVCS